MSGQTAPNGQALPWRMQRAENDIQKLDEEKADKTDMVLIREDVKSVKRIVVGAFVGIFVTVVASALLVVLTAPPS